MVGESVFNDWVRFLARLFRWEVLEKTAMAMDMEARMR